MLRREYCIKDSSLVHSIEALIRDTTSSTTQ